MMILRKRSQQKHFNLWLRWDKGTLFCFVQTEAEKGLTLYFLLLSKRGSQRLTGGAKNPVSSAVAVPDAVPSVGEVLDPVSGQSQLCGVVAVTGVGVPVEVTERALQHTEEAIHVAHHKL